VLLQLSLHAICKCVADGSSAEKAQRLADGDTSTASAVPPHSAAKPKSSGAAHGHLPPTSPGTIRSTSRGAANRGGMATQASRGSVSSRGTAVNAVSSMGSIHDSSAAKVCEAAEKSTTATT
jgi:hypothetical protein